MNRPNITPGTWIVSRLASPDYAPQFGIYSTETENDFVIAKGDDAEANAQAIVALPALLDALEKAAIYTHAMSLKGYTLKERRTLAPGTNKTIAAALLAAGYTD